MTTHVIEGAVLQNLLEFQDLRIMPSSVAILKQGMTPFVWMTLCAERRKLSERGLTPLQGEDLV